MVPLVRCKYLLELILLVDLDNCHIVSDLRTALAYRSVVCVCAVLQRAVLCELQLEFPIPIDLSRRLFLAQPHSILLFIKSVGVYEALLEVLVNVIPAEFFKVTHIHRIKLWPHV